MKTPAPNTDVSLLGKDFGYGPLDLESATYHAAWKASSGHPGGWRVTRGISPLQELENKKGRPILFRSRSSAQSRADALNDAPPMKTLAPCDHDECPPTRCTRTAIPRRPWLLSKQYGMTFVLSQDNEIILGSDTCRKLGDDLCKYIIESVNARMMEDDNWNI